MTFQKNTTSIYGFEDYNIVPIYSNIFKNTWGYYLPYHFENRAGNYIITRDLPVKVAEVPSLISPYWHTIGFEPALCENHKELLDTAGKVYVHPSCKLSRSMMAEKYKKGLNPYLSDAVVIPDPNFDDLRLSDNVLFVNEKAKLIVSVEVDTLEEGVASLVNSFHEGNKLGSLITCGLNTDRYRNSPYTTEDIRDAEFMYTGSLLYVPNTCNYIMDILTNSIPVDKIVYQSSVQESLSSETNQLDFDSLTSIKDMLDSTDENTVAAGLKALSMMDWMHYPNSIKYIMKSVDEHKWRWNNAANSTSVKYMMNTISNSTSRRYWPGNYHDEIYEQDYELFKQLKMHYEKVSQDKILEYIRMADFMGVRDGMVVPNLRVS